MIKPIRKWVNFQSPYTCMAIVIGVYVLKASMKIIAGTRVGSLAMRSDGFHNLSDILEALVIIFAIYVARRPRSERFPLGLASAENIVSLGIGLVVTLLGLSFLVSSTLGLLLYFGVPFEVPGLVKWLVVVPKTDIMEGGTFVFGIAVVVVCVTLSLLTSRYQISLGKKLNSPSLVSDGKESFSDCLTEISVLVGVVGKKLALPYLDSVAGLLVAAFILRTGGELVVNASKILLNISIEKGELQKIAATIMEAKGVKRVVSLYAYTIGKSVFAVGEIAVSEHVTFGAVHHIRVPIENKIKARVPSVSRVFLTFVPEEPVRKRCLFGIGADRGIRSLIVPRFLQAKNYVILDVVGDRIGTASIFPNTFVSQEQLVEFAKEKKVDVIYWAREPEGLKEKLPDGIRTEQTAALTLGNIFGG